MARFHYPRFFAHRGGGALAPENTLAGIALASRLGLRGVEFDAMLSADSVPVLIHDETLERTTSGEGCVTQATIADLRRLDAGARFHSAYAGTRLPTLDEALDLCASLGLVANVEIKPAAGRAHETGTAVGRALAQRDPGALLVSSFDAEALAAAREAAPEIPSALLFERVPGDWRDRLARLDCFALHCAATAMDAQLARTLAAAGVPWACYTVNREDEAARLFGLGAAALFTDRLDLFADAKIGAS